MLTDLVNGGVNHFAPIFGSWLANQFSVSMMIESFPVAVSIAVSIMSQLTVNSDITVLRQLSEIQTFVKF